MAKKKDVPNPVTVTAFQIASELEAIKNKIMLADGELADGDFEALQKWEAAIETKAENIGHVKEQLDRLAEYFKAVEDKAKERRKSIETSVSRLKKYLLACMTTAGIKSLKKEDGLFSVTVCNGRSSVVIDSQDKLPVEMVDIIEVVKPRTDQIKEALETGKEVDGAHLEYGENYLMIR